MCDVQNTVSGSRIVSAVSDLESGDISKSMSARDRTIACRGKKTKTDQRIGVEREIQFRRRVGSSVCAACKKAALLSSV
jgi:hypothetical protein